MTTYRDDWRLTRFFKVIGAIALVGGCAIASGNLALAQVIPDATLGAELSVVTSPQPGGFQIEGGATRGTNLFHSFSQFSVPTNGFAYFNNALTIQNIISRVTSASVSNIDGLIRANGTANLFLINPNGIIFGPNATLNVGGSFLASTANSLIFGNGFEFSATNPQAPPLLTINIPLGLQYRANPGRIVNQSVDGLQIQPERTLALVGGEVALEGSTLKAPDGRIELGSVAGNNQVNLTQTGTNYALSYEGVENFQDVRLTQGAFVATDGNGGGSIQVQGKNVTLTNGSQISASLLGAGKGGGLSVNASESVQVIGYSADGRFTSGLFAQAVSTATGEAGDLAITTSRLLIQDGAQVITGTSGSGNGGSLTVNASDSVQVLGTSADGKFVSNLSTQADTNTTGNAGNLTINTSKLLVLNGALVSASVLGTGEGGDLTVNASDSVQVIGESADGKFVSGLAAQAQGTGNLIVNALESVHVIGESADGRFASNLSAQSEGTGETGSFLRITTSRLLISDGAVVSAGTLGASKGGNLIVNVPGSVDSSANGQGGSPFAGFGSTTGNLTVVTGQLSIQDGARVTVSSLSGQAGNLSIATNSLFLNRGSITAETAKSGDAGGANINLQVSDVWLMRNESLISATAYGSANGGNINIDTQFLVALPPEGPKGSDIIANAQQGNGGRINITTQGLFGIEFRPKLTPDNDITASSDFGLNGEVTINQPDVDPRRGLTELPSTVVDATRQIDRRCTPARADHRSSFVVTGRGGLPPSPNETLQGETVITNWVTLDSKAENTNSELPKANSTSTSTAPKELVEAQSWVYGSDGRVILVAEALSATPQSPWQTSPSCRDIQTTAK